jgi:hypothetical protein
MGKNDVSYTGTPPEGFPAMSLSDLSSIAVLATLGLVAVMIIGASGYGFDLRRRQRRSGDDGRSGGRREIDALAK